MRRHAVFLFVFAAAGCASAPPAPFDASADPRIGTEVDKACFAGQADRGGRHMRIADRDTFLIGRRHQQYLLVFGRGCSDIGPSGAFPIFRNFGDNCRRRGELVETARGGSGVTGGCAIEHIYVWEEAAGAAEGE